MDAYLTQIQALSNQSCLPHAWLMIGPNQDAKELLAKQLSQWLFCSQAQEHSLACGTCRQCQLFIAETHPDFFHLLPEKEGGTIKVQEIRTLIDYIVGKPQIADKKIVIISPAEAMNLQAANAFLKTLEEPADNTYIFLLTQQVHALLPTIVSRCQQLMVAGENKKIADNGIKKIILNG